jgi:type I restriction enzyme S subunit
MSRMEKERASHEDTKTRRGSRIEELIAELCPEGVEFRALASLGRRNSGTSITAGKMKTITVELGPVRVFAGGQTIADVPEDAIPQKDIVREPSIIVKSRGHIGFTYYEEPFTHKSELWSYTVTDPLVDQKFVYYFLLTRVSELQETARVTSVKLPQLGVRNTDNLRIPIPPLEIQREIVKVLDTFTKLEAELETELEAELEARRWQYQYYRDALLAFKDQNVRWVRMSEVGEFFRGRRFTKDDYVPDGIGCIHYGDIYTQYGTAAKETVSRVRSDMVSTLRFAKPGDLVIAGVGETVEDVGKAVAWLGDGEVAIHDDCFAFRHSLNPKFVSYYFQTAAFHAEKNKFVARAKIKRLSAENIGKLTIPVPPPDEQERIVAILDKFDALVNDLGCGLPAEITARRQQHAHYRDRLLSFNEFPSRGGVPEGRGGSFPSSGGVAGEA